MKFFKQAFYWVSAPAAIPFYIWAQFKVPGQDFARKVMDKHDDIVRWL